MLIFFGLAIFLVMLATIYSESTGNDVKDTDAPFLQVESKWIDSMMQHMSLEEKVGQLLIVVAEPDTSEDQYPITRWLKTSNVGGVVFRNYSLEQQYKRTHIYQSYSRNPLLIGMYGNRDKAEFVQFPDAWSLAAIEENSLVANLGKEVARQSKELGNNFYITPYETHRNSTVGKIITVSDQIQDKQVLACHKLSHTDIASKKMLRHRDSLMAPYASMAKSGVSALMVDAELVVRDSSVNIEGNFSVKDYLKEQIGYKGLLMVELADTVDITVYLSKLMRAGVDVVILNKDVDKAARTITQLVKGNYLSHREIDQKVRKILRAKYWAGAVDFHKLAKNKELPSIPASAPPLLNRQLTEASITVLKDEKELLPFKELDSKKLYMINVGEELREFHNFMNLYSVIDKQSAEIDVEDGLVYTNKGELALYNTLLLTLNIPHMDTLISNKLMSELKQLRETHEVVVLNFASPSNLKHLSQFSTVVQMYNNRPLTQEIAAQVLFGGVGAKGKLPLTINKTFVAGTGITTEPIRLSYTIPEAENIASADLLKIDSIVQEGIDEFAMPGCQILVAKKGQVIFNKAFGHHTYAQNQAVRPTDVYDLASITKVAATTIASMKMYEQSKLNLDVMLGDYFNNNRIQFDSATHDVKYKVDTMRYEDYVALHGELENNDDQISLIENQELPMARNKQNAVRYQDSLVVIYTPTTLTLSNESNIFNVTLRELLTHHSGLEPSLPIMSYIYYRGRDHSPFGSFYDRVPNGDYSVQVAGDFYLNKRLIDSMWQDAKYLKINENKNYKYSDVNMILVQRAIDSVNQYGMDQYLDSNFYMPLGLQTTRFNPRRSLISRRLVPTEYDYRWRKQLLRGYVHDPTAALMGGVAGNAGLFSNANDLAILFQMLLNGGEYGGEEFLDEETIEMFIDRHLGHRGLGFDKPPLRGRYTIGSMASPNSYGHTGFTGTCVWVDPDEELVYVFLSNRVHPTPNNRKLIELRIRERIHDVVYQAINNSRERALTDLEGSYSALEEVEQVEEESYAQSALD